PAARLIELSPGMGGKPYARSPALVQIGEKLLDAKEGFSMGGEEGIDAQEYDEFDLAQDAAPRIRDHFMASSHEENDLRKRSRAKKRRADGSARPLPQPNLAGVDFALLTGGRSRTGSRL